MMSQYRKLRAVTGKRGGKLFVGLFTKEELLSDPPGNISYDNSLDDVSDNSLIIWKKWIKGDMEEITVFSTLDEVREYWDKAFPNDPFSLVVPKDSKAYLKKAGSRPRRKPKRPVA